MSLIYGSLPAIKPDATAFSYTVEDSRGKSQSLTTYFQTGDFSDIATRTLKTQQGEDTTPELKHKLVAFVNAKKEADSEAKFRKGIVAFSRVLLVVGIVATVATACLIPGLLPAALCVLALGAGMTFLTSVLYTDKDRKFHEKNESLIQAILQHEKTATQRKHEATAVDGKDMSKYTRVQQQLDAELAELSAAIANQDSQLDAEAAKRTEAANKKWQDNKRQIDEGLARLQAMRAEGKSLQWQSATPATQ